MKKYILIEFNNERIDFLFKNHIPYKIITIKKEK